MVSPLPDSILRQIERYGSIRATCPGDYPASFTQHTQTPKAKLDAKYETKRRRIEETQALYDTGAWALTTRLIQWSNETLHHEWYQDCLVHIRTGERKDIPNYVAKALKTR